MKNWVKYLIVTLVLGIPAFMLGPVFWPPTKEAAPTALQLPFFMLLSALEALLFGFGVALIAFNVKKLNNSNKLTKWAFAALSWLLVSWWPHDSLHIHNGMNMQGLLYIDYGFHLTLMTAGLILAVYFMRGLKK